MGTLRDDLGDLCTVREGGWESPVCAGGLSDSIANTIRVKQGYLLSPTLFGLYIDEVADYIQQGGGTWAEILGTQVYIILYANDIILISETHARLQQHLHALESFCMEQGMTVNFWKTKVMIFHTSTTVKRQHIFTFAGSQVQVSDSYVHLVITLTSRLGRFTMPGSLWSSNKSICFIGYVREEMPLGTFPGARMKGWLLETLVTPALMYATPVWTPSSWGRLERP